MQQAAGGTKMSLESRGATSLSLPRPVTSQRVDGRECTVCRIDDGIAAVRICEAIDRAADSNHQVDMLAGYWVAPPRWGPAWTLRRPE